MLQYQRIGRTGWQDGGTAITRSGGRAEWSVLARGVDPIPGAAPGVGPAAPVDKPVRKVYVKPVVRAGLKRDWVRPDGVVKLAGRGAPRLRGGAGDAAAPRRWTVAHRRTHPAGRSRSVRLPHRRHARLRAAGVPGGAREPRSTTWAPPATPMRLTTVRLVTYHIETRGKVRGALDSFKERTAEIYADPRGWSRANVHFKRVKSGGAFSLVLSQAKYVPTFAPICDRYWSCRVGRYVIINEDRWRRGTPYFKKSGGTLREYRAMVVNHETGHWFGLGHASCGGQGSGRPR